MSNSSDPDQDRHSGAKLFAKVIIRRQKLPLAGEELTINSNGIFKARSSLILVFAIKIASFLGKSVPLKT